MTKVLSSWNSHIDECNNSMKYKSCENTCNDHLLMLWQDLEKYISEVFSNYLAKPFTRDQITVI